MIATRIADMKQHMQVTDKESGQLRPLRYSDIVILLRSLKDYGTDFVQVLQGAGYRHMWNLRPDIFRHRRFRRCWQCADSG